MPVSAVSVETTTVSTETTTEAHITAQEITADDSAYSITIPSATSLENVVIEKILKAFPDAPIMVMVARCESGLRADADRGNLGIDVGLFQINQIHLPRLKELGLDRWNIDDNIKFARILYDEGGLAPWESSRYCWGSA